MALEVLLVQFLVLVFTGALWWIARRDLALRALPPVVDTTPDTSELEQLCATLEALVTDQARRLEALERQTAARHTPAAEPLPSFAEVGALIAASSPPSAPIVEIAPVLPLPVETPAALMPRMPALSPTAPQWDPAPVEYKEETPPEDPRFAPLNALLEQGVTDPAELVRQTGLGRGEVDLILSLRGRRAL